MKMLTNVIENYLKFHRNDFVLNIEKIKFNLKRKKKNLAKKERPKR